MKANISRLIIAADAAIARLHRQRPLRAGSLLITLFGDAIAPRGGIISLSSLITLAALFGLPERLVRTSIARLANEGWVISERSGRASDYRLTEDGRARFAEATERIYGASPQSWSGKWTLILIPPSLKKQRESVREELGWLGFGELMPGLFAHPTHDGSVIQARLTELEALGKLVVIKNAVVTQAADTQLIEMGWDLSELTRRYKRFIALYLPISENVASVSPRDVPGDTAFVLRTLLLHEYRKIHLRDPLLPIALLPPNWAGAEAYALCRKLYTRVFSASEHYLAANAETLTGVLPAASVSVLSRFGGLNI